MLRIELDTTTASKKIVKIVSKKTSIGLSHPEPSERLMKICIGLKKKRKIGKTEPEASV